MNARFWVYANEGPVKLTLRPGQSLSHHTGGRADEGWSYEGTTWEYPADEPVVCRKWAVEALDCDGRHGHWGEDVCHLSRLQSGAEPYFNEEDRQDRQTWEGVIWPAWESENRGQRDQYAEIAGY